MSGLFWKMRIMRMYPHLFMEPESKPKKKKTLPRKESSYCPLMNILILHKILSHLTPNEQLKCRSVCQFWNDEITAMFRRKTQDMKTVKNEEELRKLNAAFKHSKGILPVNTLQVFIKEMRRPQFDFLQISSLGKSIVDMKIVVVSHLVPIILTCLVNFSALKNLTIIRIPEDTLESIYVARDINFGVTEFSGFPFRTKLKFLEKVIFENWAPDKRLLFSYADVVNAFLRRIPNLKILVFNDWSGLFYQVFCNFQFINVEELVVKGRSLGHDEITFLISKGLPKIQKLEVTIAPTVSCKLIRELLQSVRGTLKSHRIIHMKHKHKPLLA